MRRQTKIPTKTVLVSSLVYPQRDNDVERSVERTSAAADRRFNLFYVAVNIATLPEYKNLVLVALDSEHPGSQKAVN
jgi:hypothetical protein